MASYRRLEFSARTADQLRDSALRVVVTGASGWLGQASLEMLESALGDDVHARVFAFGSRARPLPLRSKREIAVEPLECLPNLEAAPTLLLHYAFLGRERTVDLDPEEYAQRIACMRKIVSDALRAIHVTHLVLSSSGAVYGLPTRADRSLVTDPVQNPYGTQKMIDEDHFRGLCSGLGIRIAIPRIFNISGPYINKRQSYALSSVISAALSGGPIVLRAHGRVIRTYTSVRDLIDISVGWLLREARADATVYDTAGEPVEIGQLAELVIGIADRVGIRVCRPALMHEPDDVYVGDGGVFESMADQQGVALSDLRTQIAETMEYLAAVH